MVTVLPRDVIHGWTMNTGLAENFIPDVSADSASFIKGQVKMKYMPVLFSCSAVSLVGG